MPKIGDTLRKDEIKPTQRELDKLARKFGKVRTNNKGGK